VIESSFVEHGNFLNKDILRGSVVTYLRSDGIFSDDFIKNLLLSLQVKEVGKSFNIGEVTV